MLQSFEEEAIDLFVAGLQELAPEFDNFIQSLSPYKKGSLRQHIDAEQMFYLKLQNLT